MGLRKFEAMQTRSCACGAASPWREHFVDGGCGDCGFVDGEKLTADEPADGGLRGAFGDADGLGEVLVADLDGGATALLLGGEPDVDEEAGGAAVMTDEIAQEDFGDVGIELQHGYTDG